MVGIKEGIMLYNDTWDGSKTKYTTIEPYLNGQSVTPIGIILEVSRDEVRICIYGAYRYGGFQPFGGLIKIDKREIRTDNFTNREFEDD